MYKIVVKKNDRLVIDETYADYDKAMADLDVLEASFGHLGYVIDFRDTNYFNDERK
jgi:hypothetical protein